MNLAAALKKSLVASPIVAAVAYAGVVSALMVLVVTSGIGLLSQRDEVASSAALLEQLEGHKPAPADGRRGAQLPMPSGSAFLEGVTVTVAGAALLQRVAGAVAKSGGKVLSSQLDLQGSQSKAGFVTMVASCEIEQPALPPLIYDIEAGMPFLFIDQLAIQASTNPSGEGKLRVLLTVSGQWQAGK